MSEKLVKFINTKMGNTKSKSDTKGRRSKQSWLQRQDSKPNVLHADTSPNRNRTEEDPELIRLRDSIKNHPDAFILNNLMMCVEFFRNYDEAMSQTKKTLVSQRETSLNNRLLPQKRVLLPDVLQEQISLNVTFISRRETIDLTVEPLQPVRMFIVYENIEVSEQGDSSQYSNMNDTVTYNMRLKPSKNKGYVHLERIGITTSKKAHDVEDLFSITEDSSGFFSDEYSKLYDSPFSEPLSRQSETALMSPSAAPKKFTGRSSPNLYNNETPTTSVYHKSRVLVDEDKSSFESSNNDKDYRSLNEFGSSQMQEKAIEGDLGGHKYVISRNTRKYSRVKIRSYSASPASSTSSGYKSGNYDSDSDCGYSTVKICNKQKNLDATEMPESCFFQVTCTQDNRVHDPIAEKECIISSKERMIQDVRNRRNYEVFYLSSSRFRRRFYNVFVESLASELNLEEAIRYCRPYRFGSAIYCDKIEVSRTSKWNISESYEITPCVWSQWPVCASEWLDRRRNSWPSYEAINHIRKSGCYIIPQELSNQDSNYKIEWQIVFPAAERYLESCMNHAQMKVYIIALMLHKTFIRSVESAPGRLNTHQIRNQLFWLMEEKSREWFENRTGDDLVYLLKCLCNCIQVTFLNDYFMREKNLLQNSGSGSLYFSLKQLSRIIENPVMYVLHAMENIRYKTNFFPKLKSQELLKILTEDELLLVNPNLGNKINTPAAEQNPTEDDQIYNERRGRFWDDAKKKKDQFSPKHKMLVTNKTLINPSKAHDSVVDILVRCGELKGIRLSKLMDFFIENLIKMARNYHGYGSLQQKIAYLNHAKNLSILLSEDTSFEKEAYYYLKEISALRNSAINSWSQNEAPDTPKRNTGSFSSLPKLNDNSSITFPNLFSAVKSSTSSQMEYESAKETLNSSNSFFSSKNRYSSILDRPSIPLPDLNVTTSQNTSPQMAKKSDPPVFVRPLKTRYLITPSERSSLTLPVVEEGKESNINSQNGCLISAEISISKLREEKGEDARESNKDGENCVKYRVISFTDKDEETFHDTYI